MEFKEGFCGSVIFDEQSRTVTIKKKTFSFDNIVDMSYCYDTMLKFADNDNYKRDKNVILAIEFDQKVSQPGTLLGMIKTTSIMLKMESEEDAKKAIEMVGKTVELFEEDEWDDTNYPVERFIVEAKKKCNDYIRGGTMGSKPYNKAGLYAPIVKPEFSFEDATAKIVYMGTNAYGQESEWFTAHPADVFNFRDCDDIRYIIWQKASSYIVTADFRCQYIERDENAKGLWQVYFEQNETSACDAARWLKFLQDSVRGEYVKKTAATAESVNEEKKTTEPVDARVQAALDMLDGDNTSSATVESAAPAQASPVTSGRSDAEKSMLNAALDMLHTSGILTDAEYEEKKKMI